MSSPSFVKKRDGRNYPLGEEGEIMRDAEALLPSTKFNSFVEQFRILLYEPLVIFQWNERVIKLFTYFIESEDLTSRLLKFWKSRNEALSEIFGFVSISHEYLDRASYAHFLGLMVEFTDAESNQELRQNLGRQILQIVKNRENRLLYDFQMDDSSYPWYRIFSRFFGFWFEVYVVCSLSKYRSLYYLMIEFIQKGGMLSPEDRFVYLRKIAMQEFQSNECLKQKFMDFFTFGEIDIFPPRKRNQSPSSAALPDPQTLDFEITLSAGYSVLDFSSACNSNPDGHHVPFRSSRTPGGQLQMSGAPVGRSYHFVDTCNLSQQTVVPDIPEPNSCVLDDKTSVFSPSAAQGSPSYFAMDARATNFPIPATQVQDHPVLDARNEKFPMSGTQDGQSYTWLHARAPDYSNPVPAHPVLQNSPVLDAWKPEYLFPVPAALDRQSYTVLDVRSSTYLAQGGQYDTIMNPCYRGSHEAVV